MFALHYKLVFLGPNSLSRSDQIVHYLMISSGRWTSVSRCPAVCRLRRRAHTGRTAIANIIPRKKHSKDDLGDPKKGTLALC
jgi:hypothetical protein